MTKNPEKPHNHNISPKEKIFRIETTVHIDGCKGSITVAGIRCGSCECVTPIRANGKCIPYATGYEWYIDTKGLAENALYHFTMATEQNGYI